MPRQAIHIIKSTVEALPGLKAGEKEVTYKDSKLPGFCVRVRSTGKVYAVEGWVAKAGRSIRCTIGPHGKVTAEAARKEAHRLLGLMAQGIDPNRQQKADRMQEARQKARTKTVAQIWKEYQETKSLADSTIYENTRTLERAFPDWLDMPMEAITADMAAARYKELSKHVGPRSNSDGAKASADRAMRILHSLFEFCLFKYIDADGRSILPGNPVKRGLKLTSRNRPVRRDRYIRDADMRDWHQSVMGLENETVRDLFLLLLLTGLRRGEACRLTWQDIDLKHKTLTVPASSAKNRLSHQLPLSDWLFDILDRRHRERVSIYVFPGASPNRPLAEPKRQVAKVSEKVPFSCHDARRTFITISERLAIPSRTQKRLLNHTTSDVTDGYIQVRTEDLREPMQLITDRIKELCGV